MEHSTCAVLFGRMSCEQFSVACTFYRCIAACAAKCYLHWNRTHRIVPAWHPKFAEHWYHLFEFNASPSSWQFVILFDQHRKVSEANHKRQFDHDSCHLIHFCFYRLGYTMLAPNPIFRNYTIENHQICSVLNGVPFINICKNNQERKWSVEIEIRIESGTWRAFFSSSTRR